MLLGSFVALELFETCENSRTSLVDIHIGPAR